MAKTKKKPAKALTAAQKEHLRRWRATTDAIYSKGVECIKRGQEIGFHAKCEAREAIHGGIYQELVPGSIFIEITLP